MFDDRTEKFLATLDSRAQAKFRPFILAAKELATLNGCEYVAIGGNRTWREQDELFAKGRSKPGSKVTNARGGESNHNFGIALDFGVFKGGKYLDESDPARASTVHKLIGKLADDFGIEWGGAWKSFKDEPHFEVAIGLTMDQKRKRYKENGTVFPV